jgi:hypothetical protein
LKGPEVFLSVISLPEPGKLSKETSQGWIIWEPEKAIGAETDLRLGVRPLSS